MSLEDFSLVVCGVEESSISLYTMCHFTCCDGDGIVSFSDGSIFVEIISGNSDVFSSLINGSRVSIEEVPMRIELSG